MRSLNKDELLAQLAEKERRIQGHLEALKSEGDRVTRSLKDRAEAVGGQLREAAGHAQTAVPLALAGGLALWLAGKALAGAWRRRRRTAHRRLNARELALLMEAVSWHVQNPKAVPPAAQAPPEPPARPAGGRSAAGQLFLMLLAGLAGAALAQVPWREILEGLPSPRRGAEPPPPAGAEPGSGSPGG